MWGRSQEHFNFFESLETLRFRILNIKISKMQFLYLLCSQYLSRDWFNNILSILVWIQRGQSNILDGNKLQWLIANSKRDWFDWLRLLLLKNYKVFYKIQILIARLTTGGLNISKCIMDMVNYFFTKTYGGDVAQLVGALDSAQRTWVRFLAQANLANFSLRSTLKVKIWVTLDVSNKTDDHRKK